MNEVNSSMVVDFDVAPKVWSSGILVRRRLVCDVREKLKLSGGDRD